MGECLSSGRDERDREVEREIERDKLLETKVHKLLLLGTGGSGKTTFFKQLKAIHGEGHSQREKESFRKQIYGQVIESMQILIRQCELVAKGSPEEIEDDDRAENLQKVIQNEELSEYKISDEFEESTKYLKALPNGSAQIDEQLAKHIGKLWAECKPIRKMFEHRNMICVPDSSSYFFDEIDKIALSDYLPDASDILLVRYRTTGMQEREFCINEAIFKILDVGGQRNERKKWIFFFEGVTAILFVISLTCYDEIPFEDVSDLGVDVSSSNSMLESIKVFENTLQLQCFQETTFILFFNKADLLAEKIKHVPITCAFPGYKGPQEFKPAVEYIRNYFLSLNKNKAREMLLRFLYFFNIRQKQIVKGSFFCCCNNTFLFLICTVHSPPFFFFSTHVTTATDSRNVEKVFNDVQQCVVNWSIKHAGLD
ncbi:GTP-binding alpha subunit [Reticulomyxa filosa]|uniref:GTP-binding alpha subunit n=1 Tax=Reticulomyxa filosa TaxID=46433 RepID=X6MKZ7_RETFI|nr:GTP-binding alpha subunit [Reticulomyxa filosa]|eukprot:ETO13745.1 GTP-binding alpha subunit [Reticulomyxa filosa]